MLADVFTALWDWLRAHEALLWWLGALSIASLVLAVLLLPVMVARLPADYFVAPPAQLRPHTLRGWLARIGRNALAVLFVVAGVVMLLLPGQGLLTILIGLLLLDFPGKRALELRLVRRPALRAFLDRLREKRGQAPFRVEPVATAPSTIATPPDAKASRWWRWPAAALIGVAAFAMSCAFFAPLCESRALGLDFAAMANDPFGWHGPTPHRLLGPLLAWLLGLGGDRYWIFAHATVVVFLALVAALAMQRGVHVLGASLLAGVVAVTGAVEVFKGLVGYPEPLCYALLLLGAMLVRRSAWFWLVMFLGLLTHEGTAFVWPWLLWVKCHENGAPRRGDALGFALVVATYAAIRWSILAAATQPVHDAKLYADAPLTAATLGMWALAGLSIGIYFGVLPILLAWHARACGWRAASVPIVLALVGIFAMCRYAVDLPRFVGYLALPVVLAGIALLQRPGGWLWLGGLGVATAVAIVQQRRVVTMIVDGVGRHQPEPMPALVIDLWPVFVGYAVAFAAMVALGIVWARRWRA